MGYIVYGQPKRSLTDTAIAGYCWYVFSADSTEVMFLRELIANYAARASVRSLDEHDHLPLEICCFRSSVVTLWFLYGLSMVALRIFSSVFAELPIAYYQVAGLPKKITLYYLVAV